MGTILTDYEEILDKAISNALEKNMQQLLDAITSQLTSVGVFATINGYSKRDIFIHLTEKIIHSVDSNLEIIPESFTEEQLSFPNPKNTEITLYIIDELKRMNIEKLINMLMGVQNG